MIPEQSCDQESGKCRCLPNWEGESCDVDFDECQQELHNCDVKKEMCRNFPGGFECTVIEAVVSKQTNGMCSTLNSLYYEGRSRNTRKSPITLLLLIQFS